LPNDHSEKSLWEAKKGLRFCNCSPYKVLA
jgi:hypothetical protein